MKTGAILGRSYGFCSAACSRLV